VTLTDCFIPSTNVQCSSKTTTWRIEKSKTTHMLHNTWGKHVMSYTGPHNVRNGSYSKQSLCFSCCIDCITRRNMAMRLRRRRLLFFLQYGLCSQIQPTTTTTTLMLLNFADMHLQNMQTERSWQLNQWRDSAECDLFSLRFVKGQTRPNCLFAVVKLWCPEEFTQVKLSQLVLRYWSNCIRKQMLCI